MTAVEKEYYTPEEVATIFAVSVKTVYGYAACGALQRIPFGRPVRFSIKTINEVRKRGIRPEETKGRR